ncbi:MAG: peptidylprolyl isomerase [Solirubrobacterales bacterium]
MEAQQEQQQGGGTDRRWIILAGFALVAAIVVGAVLIGRSGGDDGGSGGDGPEQVLEAGEKATAVVKTNKGSFEIALDTERAPETTNSFAYLAEDGFYDGLDFHRIVPGFVIQGGDPKGDGTGGPGYKVVEAPPDDLEYTKGVVAMAKSGTEAAGTSGSQFFVVTGADAGLPPEYALLGEVSSGLDVVEAIGELGGSDEKPTEEVVIESVEIKTE